MTSSFMKRELCALKTNVMYMYVRSMDVVYFCDYYPLTNEVGKGYSNATVRPSFGEYGNVSDIYIYFYINFQMKMKTTKM
jgi:hypothetical protein